LIKNPIAFDTPFDTYTALDIIGEGSAGRVYVVKNASGEEFALKCLTPQRITTERLKRFKNEIQFCQNYSHPNIVSITDTGSILVKGVKCPFYVMHRYAGTLRTLMGKLKPDEVLPLFSQILNGVEAAHLAKVWHRDLKPENILYEQRENRLLIADFGIAHFEEEEIYTVVETKAADRLANFQYSAPEQRIRNSKVDHRADIFALGLILNELFTGEVLQGAGHRRIGDIAATYAYLDDLVELMTQQNPEKRPGSIEIIKLELIARKNKFVAIQKYDEAKKQVISASELPQFDPIRIVNFDYGDGMLKLNLSRNVPSGWVQEFQNPRGGHSSILGYGPGQFVISGDIASIGVRDDENFIQQIIDHAKNYVNMANAGYVQQIQEHARKEEQQQKAALEKKIAEAEKRKNILSKIKL